VIELVGTVNGEPPRIRGCRYVRAVSSADILHHLQRDRTVLSPLRYPGGKRRLVPYVAVALAVNDLKPGLFVEPFAGGASVSLELLYAKLVERIGLADSDPMVAAFWETVFEDADWLCRKVENMPVDLETWTRLKRGRLRARRQLALACLFLNRTSFNGALHCRAGPIGGHAQAGDYALDCRFPRPRLVKRIRACEALSDRVDFVRCDDAGRVISYARKRAREKGWRAFFYLDPPFWAKSSLLYRHSFQEWQHRELAESLTWLKEDPWLLSYDPAPEIAEMYRDHEDVAIKEIELLYTGSVRAAGRELIISNVETLPEHAPLWRPSEAWTEFRRELRRRAASYD
jgi:DNA adenine methylase